MTKSIDMSLPKEPMAPIASPDIPEGPEWGFQIKWDGIRTLVRLDGAGGVEIFNKKVQSKANRFPEIFELFRQLKLGPCVIDGEIVYFDGERPNFSRVMLSVAKKKFNESMIFVAFDLLYDNGEDIRKRPFRERYARLVDMFPKDHPRLLVTELHSDGAALWKWVEEHEWEGVVSKRLDSPYVEGKKHKGLWLKKRKEVRITADVVGLGLKNGWVDSLILRYEGRYVGSVSGLDMASKRVLQHYMLSYPGECPFHGKDKWGSVAWLAVPFPCKVSALEYTESGKLRHAKIIGFGAQ